MSVVKQALFAGAVFTVALLLLALTGCKAAPTTNSSGSAAKSTFSSASASASSSSKQLSPASSSAPTSSSSQEGTTEIFSFYGLKVEVTNVREIQQGSGYDGMETWTYDIYVVYPGATVTVLNAGMSDPNYSEDGQPHAQYGFLISQDDPEKNIKLVDGMDPVEITPDLTGIYSLEASVYVLEFKMYDGNAKGQNTSKSAT